jgi:hypothetical protein
MKTVTLSRASSSTDKPGNHRVDISITSSNDITSYLLVKRRVKLPDNTFDDTFVTVANPVQIEDIPQSTPASGDEYFRDKSISLVSSDPEYLSQVVDQVYADIQLTLIQATELEILSVADTVEITPESITVTSGSPS